MVQHIRSATQRRRHPPLAGEREDELRGTLRTLRALLNEVDLEERLAPDTAAVGQLALAQQMIAERHRRYQYFNGHLFSDPAWDIILELFVAELEMREVPVTNLCVTSNVPDTTVLRWIKLLELEELVVRRKDRVDKRRVLVQLSRPAAESMRRYMEEQARQASRLHAANG